MRPPSPLAIAQAALTERARAVGKVHHLRWWLLGCASEPRRREECAHHLERSRSLAPPALLSPHLRLGQLAAHVAVERRHQLLLLHLGRLGARRCWRRHLELPRDVGALSLSALYHIWGAARARAWSACARTLQRSWQRGPLNVCWGPRCLRAAFVRVLGAAGQVCKAKHPLFLSLPSLIAAALSKSTLTLFVH